jgi:hypothetical protein
MIDLKSKMALFWYTITKYHGPKKWYCNIKNPQKVIYYHDIILNCFSINFPSPAGSNCPFLCSYTPYMNTKNDNLNRPDSESYLQSTLSLIWSLVTSGAYLCLSSKAPRSLWSMLAKVSLIGDPDPFWIQMTKAKIAKR